jgi:uncharacterized protein YggE
MRQLLTISLTITLVACLATAARAGSVPRTITVFGAAERWVEPDIAVFDITVERKGDELGPLHAASNAELARVLQITAALDVPRDRVAAGRLNVTKHDQRDKHGNRKGFSHFTLLRKVSVELHDLGRFDEFLTALLAGGDLNTRLLWRLSAARSIQQDLKLEAVQDARDKAEAMATALGMRLGAPLIISEWPIVTDPRRVEDALSREAGFALRLKPERIKLRERAYIRFELIADPLATATPESALASPGGG